MKWIKFAFQFWCMASDLIFWAAFIYAGYFFSQIVPNWPVVLLILVLVLFPRQAIGFFAWRPRNIKSFFRNMKAIDR